MIDWYFLKMLFSIFVYLFYYHFIRLSPKISRSLLAQSLWIASWWVSFAFSLMPPCHLLLPRSLLAGGVNKLMKTKYAEVLVIVTSCIIGALWFFGVQRFSVCLRCRRSGLNSTGAPKKRVHLSLCIRLVLNMFIIYKLTQIFAQFYILYIF